MKISYLAATAALAAAPLVPATARTLSPEKAVIGAAKHADIGLYGTFRMKVRATGRVENRFFLNSEEDYRDQRNLSIVLPWPVAVAFANRFRADPKDYFKGKWIDVRGFARRVRVDFNGPDGKPTGLYYYQTHLVVTDPAEMEIRN